MKSEKIIIDTGPIVAFVNKNDFFHSWTKTQFSQLNPPLFTCESVISEVYFLLRHTETGVNSVVQMLERGLIQFPFKLESELNAIAHLVKKYRNIPMPLADACLVRMSEQISDSLICTLDSGFKIYRENSRKIIPLIIPEMK